MHYKFSLTALLLCLCLLFTACSGSTGTDSVTTTADTAAQATTESVTTTAPPPDTTAAPEKTVKLLPTPYVDIEFTDSGEIFDAQDHVTCKLENPNLGNIVTEEVIISGEKYSVPHLYIRQAGGVARLTYRDLISRADIAELYTEGITLEAMVQNHNKFTPSTGEQIISGTCQSGGYNLSAYKGAYTFSVYTGGAYRSAHNPGGVDNTCMTHLLGVYDPEAKISTLYVNGQKAVSVKADGMLGFASGDLWKQIILGGDIGNNFVTQIHSNNFRLADYKIYSTALTAEEAEIAYEQMRVKLTDAEYDYTIEYTNVSGEVTQQGDRLFASYAASYAEVYEPKTALVNSPSIMGYAEKDNLAPTGARPATLIFTVKDNAGTLTAYAKDGSAIGPLYDAVKALNGKIIPAFRLGDAGTAAHLTAFINDNRIGDCFVMSDSADLLKQVCRATRSARPVLDLSAANGIMVKDIRLKASACGAKNVILNASSVDAEQISALRATSHTVFLVTEGSKTALHDSIFKGAMALITANPGLAIEVIESIDTRTVCIPTFLVAHRGDMQNCPENTLPSFISAAKSGAPILELDVYMTADGHLAINHDAKTTHWDKQLTCTTSTRAQLKALKSTSPKATAEDTFPFLDEVFDYFSREYTDMVIHVEIKDTRKAVVDKVIELARAADMLDRILVIGSNHDIAAYAAETYGVAVQMTRSYIYDKNNIQTSLAYACEEVVGLYSSYYTVWADSYAPLNTALRHRGIKYCTWTTTSASATDSDYARGYVEFTANTPHRCDGYAQYLTAALEADGMVRVARVNYDGTAIDVTADAVFIPLSGDVTIQNGRVSGHGSFAFSYQASVASYAYELRSLSLSQ